MVRSVQMSVLIYFPKVDIFQFEFCMTLLYSMLYTMFFIVHRFATRTLFIVIITAFRQNFFFNENTSVLSVKQEVHKIDYKYTVNVFLLKVLLFSMKKTSV